MLNHKPNLIPFSLLSTSFAARVRALEQKFPELEVRLRKQLSPAEQLPSKNLGTGTLMSRVAALERAMDTLLVAQVSSGGWGAPRYPSPALSRATHSSAPLRTHFLTQVARHRS